MTAHGIPARTTFRALVAALSQHARTSSLAGARMALVGAALVTVSAGSTLFSAARADDAKKPAAPAPAAAAAAPAAATPASPAKEAGRLEIGDNAPDFMLKNQDGKEFHLADRKGKGWTILYFYPKADSPGCRAQACAFRDTIKIIRAKNAELYGISSNKQEDQAEFHKKRQLNFDLLSDDAGKVLESYNVRRAVVGVAKRWTFILDSQLVIRNIEQDVDPAFDAQWTADTLEELQNPPKPGSEEDPN